MQRVGNKCFDVDTSLFLLSDQKVNNFCFIHIFRCDYYNELARQAQTPDQQERVLKDANPQNRKKIQAFFAKQKCMEDLTEAQSYCLPELHKKCTAAKTNVIKVSSAAYEIL